MFDYSILLFEKYIIIVNIQKDVGYAWKIFGDNK